MSRAKLYLRPLLLARMRLPPTRREPRLARPISMASPLGRTACWLASPRQPNILDADDIVWPLAHEVEAINRAVVAASNEPFLVLNRNGLEGAVDRPLNAYLYVGEVDIIALGILLLEGIGQSHPFQQGNKRTAFVAALDFIEINGGDIAAVDSEALGALAEAVILRQRDPSELLAALRRQIRF